MTNKSKQEEEEEKRRDETRRDETRRDKTRRDEKKEARSWKIQNVPARIQTSNLILARE
jgi:hypothetical protein